MLNSTSSYAVNVKFSTIFFILYDFLLPYKLSGKQCLQLNISFQWKAK